MEFKWVKGKYDALNKDLMFFWCTGDGVSEFGGLVSTSNTYAAELVTIQTDGFLYWSMGLIVNHDE